MSINKVEKENALYSLKLSDCTYEFWSFEVVSLTFNVVAMGEFCKFMVGGNSQTTETPEALP